MKRPPIVWLAFAACVVVGFSVLGWFTREMLRLDRESAEARRIASVEENIRLALWRMDSALAAVHGLEAARPWQEYEPLFRADAAYSSELTPLPAGTVMLPSPLLGFTPPFVKLHFQIKADGTIRSPQAPDEDLRYAALAAGTPVEKLDAAARALDDLRTRLGAVDLASLLPPIPTATLQAPPGREEAKTTPAQALVSKLTQRRAEQEAQAVIAPAVAPVEDTAQQAVPVNIPREEIQQQQLKNFAETVERGNLLYAANELNAEVAANRRSQTPSFAPVAEAVAASAAGDENAPPTPPLLADASSRDTRERTSGQTAASASAPAVTLGEARRDAGADLAKKESELATPAGIEGPPQAVWAGGELVLARRVAIGEQAIVQGAWLDWPELKAWLLSRASDLLPGAQLEPVSPGSATSALDAARRLAFLPVQLSPGNVTVDTNALTSPLRISLAAAWGSAVVGAFALALLLAGTLRLSERRGAFVSAVTHELRTPLTTFRMYTEMLAGGMVADETKRRSYVETLRKEAERLSHLVENVLSYARLERGRAASRIEETTPGAMLERFEERLRQRAQQGGLGLRVEFADRAADQPLRTDLGAVEQILFNLVDNAAKYGRPAAGDGEIVVALKTEAKAALTIRVSDRGPGIASAVRKRLFQPFSKSATEAAHSQPGVGLGLALSRRLARDELNGELLLEKTGPEGTVFRLELPSG